MCGAGGGEHGKEKLIEVKEIRKAMKANQRYYLDNHLSESGYNMKIWKIHLQRSVAVLCGHGAVLRHTADPEVKTSCLDSGYLYQSKSSTFREASGPLEGGIVGKRPECILL